MIVLKSLVNVIVNKQERVNTPIIVADVIRGPLLQSQHHGMFELDQIYCYTKHFNLPFVTYKYHPHFTR